MHMTVGRSRREMIVVLKLQLRESKCAAVEITVRPILYERNPGSALSNKSDERAEFA